VNSTFKLTDLSFH